MDPRVLDAILPYLTDLYGNPHSRTHAYGWEAETAVEKARSQIASLIGASSKDIIFTSGATESNNMLIKGIARFYKGKRNHIITTQTEHKCVLDSCRYLAEQGFEITYLPVKPDGLVDLQVLQDALKPTTCLVSIMAVNNEIGVIQPLKEIGDLLKSYQKSHKGAKAFFHSDIAQATGKIPIDVEAMGLDAASISGHKLYGPKGVGAAYVRRRPRVRLEPLIHGGGQERGLRSGTVPTFLTVGLGEACRIAKEEMQVSGRSSFYFFFWFPLWDDEKVQRASARDRGGDSASETGGTANAIHPRKGERMMIKKPHRPTKPVHGEGLVIVQADPPSRDPFRSRFSILDSR